MKLEKFMFCIRLETIGLVFGFLGVLSAGFCLLSLICAFFYSLWMLRSITFHELQQEDGFLGIVTIITVGIILGIIIIALINMNVQLIKGIQNNQHEKIRPWLVVQSIVIAINLFGMLTFFGGRVPFSYIVSHIAGSAFQIYCFMAVQSLYENIKETSERGLLTNEQKAGHSMPPTYSIAEEKKSQLDFDYMNLV